MKTIQVTKEIYENQLNNSDWYDDDCDCFGIEIEGRLYLYNETFVGNNEFEYYLTIFDKTLYELFCEDRFVAKLAIEIAEHNSSNFCDFCTFIADCKKGECDDSKRPFLLYDIIYSL